MLSLYIFITTYSLFTVESVHYLVNVCSFLSSLFINSLVSSLSVITLRSFISTPLIYVFDVFSSSTIHSVVIQVSLTCLLCARVFSAYISNNLEQVSLRYDGRNH